MSVINLRTRLRADTKDAHKRLDHMAYQLDLSVRPDAEIFTAAHFAAYQSIVAQTPDAAALVAERLARAELDAKALRIDLSRRANLPPLIVEDDLAALYVIAGSSQGARFLMRQRQKATEDDLKCASHLLQDEQLEQLWKRVLTQLKAMPAIGEKADTVVASAIAVFRQFEIAFSMMTDQMQERVSVNA